MQKDDKMPPKLSSTDACKRNDAVAQNSGRCGEPIRLYFFVFCRKVSLRQFDSILLYEAYLLSARDTMTDCKGYAAAGGAVCRGC